MSLSLAHMSSMPHPVSSLLSHLVTLCFFADVRSCLVSFFCRAYVVSNTLEDYAPNKYSILPKNRHKEKYDAGISEVEKYLRYQVDICHLTICFVSHFFDLIIFTFWDCFTLET